MNDDPANTRTGSPPNPQAAQPHSLRSGQSTTCTFAINHLIIIINVVKMIIDTFDLMIIMIFLCNDVITIMVIILATISFTQTRQISKYEVFVSDKPLHG